MTSVAPDLKEVEFLVGPCPICRGRVDPRGPYALCHDPFWETNGVMHFGGAPITFICSSCGDPLRDRLEELRAARLRRLEAMPWYERPDYDGLAQLARTLGVEPRASLDETVALMKAVGPSVASQDPDA